MYDGISLNTSVKVDLGVYESHTVLDKAAHVFDNDNAKIANKVRHFTS